jgi:hypothetical protein
MSAWLPEVVLKEGVDWTNITFKGRGFAWVNHPENRAMIKAHHDEREALLAAAPAVYVDRVLSLFGGYSVVFAILY